MDRVDDFVVTGAAADIAGHRFFDIFRGVGFVVRSSSAFTDMMKPGVQ
jgi:hypothetical protein